MAWTLLILAGILEVGWAIGIKSLWREAPAWMFAGTGVALVGSVVLLTLAVRTLPVGTAYAVWTGIGMAGTTILGIALYGDGLETGRIVCLAMVLVGVAGLHWFEG